MHIQNQLISKNKQLKQLLKLLPCFPQHRTEITRKTCSFLYLHAACQSTKYGQNHRG